MGEFGFLGRIRNFFDYGLQAQIRIVGWVAWGSDFNGSYPCESVKSLVQLFMGFRELGFDDFG